MQSTKNKSTYSYTTAILASMALSHMQSNVLFVDSFQYTKQESEAYQCLGESELTMMCMTVSEKSLAEDWEKEDDVHWASFEPIN